MIPQPALASAPGVETRRARSHTGRAMAASPASASSVPIAEQTDEALMLAYAAGRAAAFDALYARHKGGVYRYLLRHCGNAGTADELFQDVWMNAIRARANYVVTAKFTTWLYTLAHHRLVDHWRATGQAKFVSIDDEGDPATRTAVEALPGSPRDQPDARLQEHQLGERLRAALALLPPVQRDAFLLQQEGGLSLADIAELTGVGAETVKSRLRYAIAKLRGELSSLHEEP
jgi:RNA polymerase sigma-70 factor (ECF subfamily)